MENTQGILWLTLEEQVPPVCALYEKAPKHYHVTLHFGCSAQQYEAFIGRKVLVTLEYDCWDGFIQACRVVIQDPEIAAICKNDDPHITVSMRNGIRPVQSNEMLRREHHWDPICTTISTTVEWSSF
jgi:hypothetical protein